MATLQPRGPDFSATKQKAFEDAKKMQASVIEQSAKAGKDSPPYHLNELIGKGSFGRVYKATDMKTKMMVAIKIIDIEESDTVDPKLADTFKEFLAEVNALKLLSESGAKNINHVIDALPVGQSMWMITEYCAGGSVATLMRPTAPGGLQEKWIIPILREVAEAIFWVHRQGIIHRDIKCANVLVTESGGVQLCDFGVAGIVETKVDKRTTFIGTPHWMAPELFDQDKSYGIEVDVWAFGSLVYEIASGLPPNVMAGLDLYQLGNHLKAHAPRLDGDQYSDQLKDLVAFCLVEDPQGRPTIEDVKAHPYIHNTAQRYPSSSLSLLVRGYKLWESQGGVRKSLFNPGGAQPPPEIMGLSSTALANDEWNFSTTLAFDQEVFQDTDSQAVFDVYGSDVDFDPSGMHRPSKPKSRRRPPPQQLAAMKVPLEKVFDPNTISNYEDNSRAYYGRPEPPPPPTASDLPLRNEATQPADVRESLIDLDASLSGGDLSSYVDMNTIRAGDSRVSVDYHAEPDDYEYGRAPLSDPADMNPNRRTQDWKFPSMGPPASAGPETWKFPFKTDAGSFAGSAESSAGGSSSSTTRPGLPHLATDPLSAPNHDGGDLAVPRPATQTGMRESVSSLIDLDMGMPDPTPEPTRPSTANSDAASVSGSELGLANPFALEKHASLYVPFSNREPSIYVSDDSDFATAVSSRVDDDFGNGLAGLAISEGPRPDSSMSQHARHNGNNSIGSIISMDSQLGDSPQQQQQQQQQPPPSQPLHLETNGFAGGPDYANGMDDPAFLTPQRGQGPSVAGAGAGSSPIDTGTGGPGINGANLPPPPVVPSLDVMQGQADSEAVKQELRRMTMSLGEHLAFMNNYLSSMPAAWNPAFEGQQEGIRR